MGEHDVGNDTVDRAMRLFVYGPLGLACYLKDSAPTFTELFVSRGKRELDGMRRTVEEKLGFAKPEPAPAAPSPQQRMADSVAGLSKIAAQATTMAASMAGPVVKAGAGAAATVASQAAASAQRTMAGTNGAGEAAATATSAPTDAAPDAPAAPTSAPTSGPAASSAPAAGTDAAGASAPTGSDAAGASGAAASAGDLPISGYDGLAASQIIERLDGMSRSALERVRVYELAHRARRTILASIDNLTS